MIKLPQGLISKFGRGLNIYQHMKDIFAAREIFFAQAGIVLGGGIVLSVLLFVSDMYDSIAALLNSLLAPFGVMLDIVSVAQLILAPFYVAALAYFIRDFFTMKARGDWAPILSFVWHFLKAKMVEVICALPLFALWMLIAFVDIQFAEADMISLGLRYVSYAVCVLVGLFTLRIALTFTSFGFVYLAQGKSLKEAFSKGLKLYDSHWPFVIAAFGFQMGMGYGMRWLLTIPALGSIPAVVFMVMVGRSFIPYAYYFIALTTYHKRVVKFPGK